MRRALVLANKIVAGVLTETDDMRYIAGRVDSRVRIFRCLFGIRSSMQR